MSIQLSSKTPEDLLRSRNLFESVYGEIKFEEVTDPKPEFLKEVPGIVGVNGYRSSSLRVKEREICL